MARLFLSNPSWWASIIFKKYRRHIFFICPGLLKKINPGTLQTKQKTTNINEREPTKIKLQQINRTAGLSQIFIKRDNGEIILPIKTLTKQLMLNPWKESQWCKANSLIYLETGRLKLHGLLLTNVNKNLFIWKCLLEPSLYFLAYNNLIKKHYYNFKQKTNFLPFDKIKNEKIKFVMQQLVEEITQLALNKVYNKEKYLNIFFKKKASCLLTMKKKFDIVKNWPEINWFIKIKKNNLKNLPIWHTLMNPTKQTNNNKFIEQAFERNFDAFFFSKELVRKKINNVNNQTNVNYQISISNYWILILKNLWLTKEKRYVQNFLTTTTYLTGKNQLKKLSILKNFKSINKFLHYRKKSIKQMILIFEVLKKIFKQRFFYHIENFTLLLGIKATQKKTKMCWNFIIKKTSGVKKFNKLYWSNNLKEIMRIGGKTLHTKNYIFLNKKPFKKNLLNMPTNEIIEKLQIMGFCSFKIKNKKKVIPTRQTSWIRFNKNIIIDKYLKLWKKINNYYKSTSNNNELKFISHIIKQSAICTLMNKMKLTSRKKTLKKYKKLILK